MTREGSIITLNWSDSMDSPDDPMATQLTWVGERIQFAWCTTDDPVSPGRSLGRRGRGTFHRRRAEYSGRDFPKYLDLLLLGKGGKVIMR